MYVEEKKKRRDERVRGARSVGVQQSGKRGSGGISSFRLDEVDLVSLSIVATAGIQPEHMTNTPRAEDWWKCQEGKANRRAMQPTCPLAHLVRGFVFAFLSPFFARFAFGTLQTSHGNQSYSTDPKMGRSAPKKARKGVGL